MACRSASPRAAQPPAVARHVHHAANFDEGHLRKGDHCGKRLGHEARVEAGAKDRDAVAASEFIEAERIVSVIPPRA
jgi:hypothetical protein